MLYKYYIAFINTFIIGVFTAFTQNIVIGVPEEIQNLGIQQSDFKVPLLSNGFNDIKNNDTAFFLQASDNDTKVKAWTGIDTAGFYLLVEVSDSVHLNLQDGNRIWDGDALQIGIDANGDGANGGEHEANYIGPNDAMYSIGLNFQKTVCWAHYHGNSVFSGSNTPGLYTILRDEASKTTIYKLFFPWFEFNWAYGLSPTIGLSIMINDSDPVKSQTRLKWGNGVGSKLIPGLFKLGYIQTMNEKFNSSILSRDKIWTSWDKSTIKLATNSKIPSQIRIVYSNIEQTITIPASKNQLTKLYTIDLKPEFNGSDSMNIFIEWKDIDGLNMARNYTLFNYNSIIEEVRSNFKLLIKNRNSNLAITHLSSILATIESEYNIALSNLDINPNDIENWAELTNNICQSYKENNMDENEFSDGSKPVFYTFKASSDNSLQIFSLKLPVNYSKTKSYPIIVDLHGTGNPNTLSFIGTYQEYGQKNENNKNTLEAFILKPWGRGNQGYIGYSGNDIYDCIRLVKKMYSIDENKTYLTGFSMGGWGTWYHGINYPEVWAAIAPCAGSLFRDSTLVEKVENLKHTPVLIWYGDKDASVTNAYLMQKKLNQIGNEPEMRIIKDRGHHIEYHEQVEVYKWLLSK